jgi:mercuric ion binding protein
MKKIIAVLFVATILSSCSSQSKSADKEETVIGENGISTSTFKVWGNCEMCKETIEKSLKVDGVNNADWNVDSKSLAVSYDISKISLDQIQKNIAAAGYDNVKYKGNDSAYKELPECCQYERK